MAFFVFGIFSQSRRWLGPNHHPLLPPPPPPPQSADDDVPMTARVAETYWTTKQVLMKRLGKKEDKHLAASDSELDAKLEVCYVFK